MVKYKAILISLFLSTNLLANDSNNKECLDIFGSFLGVSPENQDIFDIIKAVSKSDITSLEKLLKKGISVNTKDKRGRTLLIKAIIIGSKETVTLLLKHQVDVNLEDKNNKETPLIYAVRSDDIEIIKLLVENGAKIDAKNKDNQTAFQIAQKYGNQTIIKYLESKKL